MKVKWATAAKRQELAVPWGGVRGTGTLSSEDLWLQSLTTSARDAKIELKSQIILTTWSNSAQLSGKITKARNEQKKDSKQGVRLHTSVKVLVAQLHPLLAVLCPWESADKNTGVDSRLLPQGIFLTQGSNLGLLHCRQILYPLSHQKNPPHQWLSVNAYVWQRLTQHCKAIILQLGIEKILREKFRRK